METLNKYLVGVQGDDITVGLPMRTARMTKGDALLLAAYLVCLASDDPNEDFQPILAAIKQT